MLKKSLIPILFLACWFAVGRALPLSGRLQAPADKDAAIERIVCAAPNLTEIAFAMGLEHKIVAVADRSNWPPQAADKPVIGGFWQPDIEAVMAARPDLVMTLDFEQQLDLARRLERIGIRTLSVRLETVSDLFKAIERIGAAVGCAAGAEQLGGTIQDRIDRLVGQSCQRRMSVLWVIQRQPLRVAGRRSFVNELIELAGGVNAIGSTVHMYPAIGAEQVIRCGAEVIIQPAEDGHGDLSAQRRRAVAYWARFQELPAVKCNRIYLINPDAVSRIGPRITEGLESIAACLRDAGER